MAAIRWTFGSPKRTTTTTTGTVAGLVLAAILGGAAPGRGQGIDINQVGDPAVGLAAAPLRVIQDTLVFRGDDGLHGSELWVSDGLADTRLLVDVNPGLDWSGPAYFVGLAGTMVFSATRNGDGCGVWTSDLSPGDAHLVPGTSQGGGLGSSCPTSLTAAGDHVYYRYAHPDDGTEPMRTDGTAAGTAVFDVNPGPDSSNPVSFTAVGDVVYFVADNGADGIELHRILPNGTHEQVVNLNPTR